MTRPVRLRLSRQRGFDLQAHSHAINGLAAVNVSRPSIFGNPFIIGDHDRRTGGFIDRDTAAVERFLAALLSGGLRTSEAEVRQRLAGRNLACWCASGEACHADILLEIANGPQSQEVSPCP